MRNVARLVVLLTIGCQVHACASEPLPTDVGAFFKDYCIQCHGESDPEAELDLSLVDSHPDHLEALQSIAKVLDEKTMPPDGEASPSGEKRASVSHQLRQVVHTLAMGSESLSVTPIRRMNRFQYNNAVQDLFELKIDVFPLPERMLRDHSGYYDPASGKMPRVVRVGSRPLGKSQLIQGRLAGVGPFPQDLRAENGFDNRGDHLSLSPLLLESFLRLSQSILNSDDFNPKTVGIWQSFFHAPKQSEGGSSREDLSQEIRSRLRPFLQRAFRRDLGDPVIDRYTQYAVAQIKSGQSFTDAMKSVASAAIASPRFLYLYDTSVPPSSETSVASSQFTLASKLSFYLWGSIPDESLLSLAREGKLSESATLASQVDRMLNDKRSKRFCDSFPSQWLQLERIISSVPDRGRYPDFYFAKFRVSMHMMLEPLLLFETILIENQPIDQLIQSDFSYRSDLLQAWYAQDGRRGKTTPTVIPFERVEVTDDRQGGVITNLATMTMTSAPSETQPITRGAWIASVIFNDPPEPPPADVPPLAEKSKVNENMTLRERFADHRKRADCAVCHKQLDPLGFAMENYDVVGRWRDKYDNGRDVDPTGVLMGKHKFKEIAEFKQAILSEKHAFARALSAHLLSFAMGREVTPRDWDSLNTIVSNSAESDFRMRDLIKQVALSDSFRAQPLTR